MTILSGHLKVFTDTQHDEMVLVRDIPLYSVCEHHLLPFIGKANIAYIPRAETCWGLSSLRGLWTALPGRPQLQERLTSQIANFLMDELDPYGVAVVINAEHLCMTMRGPGLPEPAPRPPPCGG